MTDTVGLPLDAGSVCIRGTSWHYADADPLIPPPSMSTAYHQDLDDVVPPRYGRWGHDSAEQLEAVLGALDHGRTLVFNSGMAATSATILSLITRGRALVIAGDSYYETRQIADQLAVLGIPVRILHDVEAELPTAVEGAGLVLIETPSNPYLQIHDLRQCADLAHDAGALLVVDNSMSCALNQLPLEFGADVVVSSDAKVVSGHNDAILGHVTVRRDDLYEKLHYWRHIHGSVASPFTSWLVQRSIHSLQLRVERQTGNAAAITEVLAQRPEVSTLRWPGWAKDPQHDLASRQMRGSIGVLSFRMPDREHLHRFLRASRFIIPSTSYGGTQTMANDIFAWPHLDAPPGFVRLSLGCEATADLVADVSQALDAAVR